MRSLLLQVRDADDPMRSHEVECFARALQVPPESISVFDLLSGPLEGPVLELCDLVLVGGSGAYSVVGSSAWLDTALESMRTVHASGKPTFASCWGFQALARALGGTVVRDREHAEVGTVEVVLTRAGSADPVFAPAAPSFLAQMGHEDRVVELPPDALLLASTKRVPYQAFRFEGLPIYCTQFHPELAGSDLMHRFSTYPHYVQECMGTSMEALQKTLRPSPRATELLVRFVEVMGLRPPASARHQTVDGDSS